MATQVKFVVECEICDGYGIIPAEIACGVVCARCEGTGCTTIRYTPFTGIKKRQGIKTVRRSGRFSPSSGAPPKGIPYTDFLKGKRP